MTRPTDETLMAYADGYLDDQSRQAVERYLLADAFTQRFVHLMALVNVLTRQAFADQDFMRGLERLTQQIERAGTPPQRAAKEPRLHSVGWMGWGGTVAPWFSGAAAAASVCLICMALVMQQSATPPAGSIELTLGEVRKGTALGTVLYNVSTQGLPARGEMFARFETIAEFKDKFGNPCKELDAFEGSNDALPAAVVVACQRSDKTWSVLGAVATRSGAMGAYAADPMQAHNAMTGVLELLGANRRTSAIKSESETR